MSTPRPFTATSNKLAYAQAFSRASTQHVEPSRTVERRRLVATLLKHRGA